MKTPPHFAIYHLLESVVLRPQPPGHKQLNSLPAALYKKPYQCLFFTPCVAFYTYICYATNHCVTMSAGNPYTMHCHSFCPMGLCATFHADVSVPLWLFGEYWLSV